MTLSVRIHCQEQEEFCSKRTTAAVQMLHVGLPKMKRGDTCLGLPKMKR